MNCCGLEGYTINNTTCLAEQQQNLCPIDGTLNPPGAFRPLGESTRVPACQSNASSWFLEDSSFDCSVLEQVCNDVPCSGVDAELIKEMTIDADCSAEIYSIHLCMFLALALYHAIMINLINRLFYNGVTHVRWRSLNPEGIKMMTHVREDGELVRGGDKEERTARIARTMQKFERVGWILIALGTFFALIWIWSIFILRKVVSGFDMYHE
jgi:hypothetical protein